LWAIQWEYISWLVVLIPLKNISQWEGLSYILWKINMFETTNQLGISRDFMVYSGDIPSGKLGHHFSEGLQGKIIALFWIFFCYV
jgi:hypothetical protein